MTDPSKFDDDWAELARELERDKPSSTPPAACSVPPESAPTAQDSPFLDSAAEDAEESSSDEFEESSEAESNEDSVAGDGQLGSGRKRRRRRRRRRKGGQPTEVGAGDGESEKSDNGEGEVEDAGFETEPTGGESEYGDETADDLSEEPIENSTMDTDEDAGGELLRELIANWNVPSWDDVVAGLYRPER